MLRQAHRAGPTYLECLELGVQCTQQAADRWNDFSSLHAVVVQEWVGPGEDLLCDGG